MRAWLKGTNSNRRRVPLAETRTKPLLPRSTRVCATQRPAERSPSKKSASYFPSGLPPPLLAKSARRPCGNHRPHRRGRPRSRFAFREFFAGSRGLIEPVSLYGGRNQETLTSAKTPAHSNSHVLHCPQRQASSGSAASPTRLKTVSPILIHYLGGRLLTGRDHQVVQPQFECVMDEFVEAYAVEDLLERADWNSFLVFVAFHFVAYQMQSVQHFQDGIDHGRGPGQYQRAARQ